MCKRRGDIVVYSCNSDVSVFFIVFSDEAFDWRVSEYV